MAETGTPRRRSGLHQERSRQTRQRLVRAALELWTKRGFENGVEETTVEEIVRAAGVTKGTFYFHFARKEEILLEMGWETANVVNAEAQRCVVAARGLEESLGRLIGILTARISAAPPAAVARSLAEFRRRPPGEPASREHAEFATGFETLFARAQQCGELPDEMPAAEMARILQALTMDAILEWSGSRSDLREMLRRRVAVLVGGLRQPGVIS